MSTIVKTNLTPFVNMAEALYLVNRDKQESKFACDTLVTRECHELSLWYTQIQSLAQSSGFTNKESAFQMRY